MPRILFCTDTYPPQLNGVSVATAAMIAGLVDRGWECGVLAPAYPLTSRRVLWEPPAVHRFAVPSAALPTYPDVRLAWPRTHLVRHAFEAFRPHLVHCATELLIGRAALREARHRDVPVCTTYHTDFSRYCHAYGVSLLRPAVRAWIRDFHTRADCTLVPSRAAQADLMDLGVERTHVWSGGVDADLFHPRQYSVATRHRLGLGRSFTFLHVGRLAAEKSVDVVVDAFARLRASIPATPVRLVIAGTGPIERSLASRAGLGVTFIGAVDHVNELPALYASADAFVTASTTETLGLVVLEAMASGLPVVACPSGGLADYVVNGHNGLTFGAGDVSGCVSAMTRVLTDASLHERLRSGARQTAEARSAVGELDRLDVLFRGVITSWSRPRVPQSSWQVQPAL